MDDGVMISKLTKTVTVPLDKISSNITASNLEEKPKIAIAAFGSSI